MKECINQGTPKVQNIRLLENKQHRYLKQTHIVELWHLVKYENQCIKLLIYQWNPQLWRTQLWKPLVWNSKIESSTKTNLSAGDLRKQISDSLN